MMFKQKRLTVLSLSVMLALLMAAVMPNAAFAQDGTPPQPEAPVVVDEPVADEPAAEEPAAVEPAAEEPAVEEPAAEETVAEILAEVPAGTDVVVLDENGEALPLVSAEAAETILVSDPIWCEEGVNPGIAITSSQCTDGFTKVEDLIVALNLISGNGTIFFTSTYDVDDFKLDIEFPELHLLGNLVLQGGWNGLGNKTLFPSITDGLFALSGSTTVSKPVEVYWGDKNVTIKDMIFNGGSASKPGLYVETTAGNVVMQNVNASSNTGLSVRTTTGNVVMENVNASFNTGESGAYVETTTGDVRVENSQFNNNSDSANPGKATGLIVVSKGNVTLNNVTASYNAGDGVNISGTTATTGPKTVTVSNSIFNYNTSTAKSTTGNFYGDGLWIDNAQGDVTLNNVTAMYNSYNGVEVGLKSNEGKVGNGTTGNILVNGGTFAYNGNDGLHLNAGKNITLNNVTTYGNRDDGAELCAGQDININGGNYYQNMLYGTYIRCGNNVNSYYGNWWGNYYYGYYWGYPSYWHGNYYGYYGNYWGGRAFPVWGGPASVTINNIYVDGYFIPNYNTYFSFYNNYYSGFGYNNYYSGFGYNNYYYGFGWQGWGWEPGGSGYWYTRWLKYQFPAVIVTAPMSVELTLLAEDELPGELPEGKTFADAFEATVSGGIPGEVTETSFDVPEGFVEGDTLTVLSWNDPEWEEVEAEIVDGKVTFKVDGSGTFALVTP